MSGQGYAGSDRLSLSPGDAVTVVIADDQQLFLAALRELVAATPGFVLVGEAGTGEDAIRAVGELCPHVLLIDVRMPGMGGIAAVAAITLSHPDVRVVLMSIDDPQLEPGAKRLSPAVVCARKQELRPRRLRELCGLPAR